jgi:hypothetical protein
MAKSEYLYAIHIAELNIGLMHGIVRSRLLITTDPRVLGNGALLIFRGIATRVTKSYWSLADNY